MLALRAALAFTLTAGILAIVGVLSFASEASPAPQPKLIVSRAFDIVAAMPAADADLRRALTRAARSDRQPVLKTDYAVRLATIEYRSEGTSTLVRVPLLQLASR